MPEFRKKPVVIEAVQWTGENEQEVAGFFSQADSETPYFGFHPTPEPHWAINTLEGTMDAHIGDWIIKGVAGEFYPCKPGIFEATYDPVEEGD